MRILWVPKAESDLESLIDYIIHDNPQSAFSIFQAIQKTVEKLSDYPLAGREGRVARTRELVVPHLPYIVVYTVVAEIRILAVLHTSRKWPNSF